MGTATVSLYFEDFRGEELEVEVEVDVEPSVRGSFRHDAGSDIDYHGCDASASGTGSITVLDGEQVDGKWKCNEREATTEEATFVHAWINANDAEWTKQADEVARQTEIDDAESAAEDRAEARADAMMDRDWD